MTNSADPDQLASSEANWSGSTLFAKTGHVVFSKRRVKNTEMKQSNGLKGDLKPEDNRKQDHDGPDYRYW